MKNVIAPASSVAGQDRLRAKIAPCRQACPAGVDVPRYVRLVGEGRFADALAVVRERIPFPLVCGYACVRPCEAKCGRGQWEAPVAIRALKRVAAQRGASGISAPVRLPLTQHKVAVIGSGPAGLTSAYFLSLQGHEVSVFEARDQVGGMLRFGIPGFRLPGDALAADLEQIERAGVRMCTGSRVESAEALLGQGYHAVFIATGAWRGLRLGIPGEDQHPVIDGLSFLDALRCGSPPTLGERVIVVGGGNTAIDAARSARRLGAQVVVLYRRGREEMPAAADEVAEAIEEGVWIETLTAPVRFDAGALICQRMSLGASDASGRRRPVPIAGSEFRIEPTDVIAAIGQAVVVPATTVARSANGAVAVDALTLATSVPGIFAGGDAVTGPASIIVAIAQGRLAAAAIDRMLGGSGAIDRPASSVGGDTKSTRSARGTLRGEPALRKSAQRITDFASVERVYTRAEAMHEARRCLSCDLSSFEVRVEAAACKDCGYCIEVCALEVFERSAEFNASGYQPAVARHAERCIGCLRCIEICPDFAIAIREVA